MSDIKAELGGELDPRQLAGREYRVTLSYSVDYELTVLAGVDNADAIDEAELKRDFQGVTPASRDLVHTEVTEVEDIFADDPRSEHCSDWCDGPTAPSSETFWDDTAHFSEDTREAYEEADGKI